MEGHKLSKSRGHVCHIPSHTATPQLPARGSPLGGLAAGWRTAWREVGNPPPAGAGQPPDSFLLGRSPVHPLITPSSLQNHSGLGSGLRLPWHMFLVLDVESI